MKLEKSPSERSRRIGIFISSCIDLEMSSLMNCFRCIFSHSIQYTYENKKSGCFTLVARNVSINILAYGRLQIFAGC